MTTVTATTSRGATWEMCQKLLNSPCCKAIGKSCRDLYLLFEGMAKSARKSTCEISGTRIVFKCSGDPSPISHELRIAGNKIDLVPVGRDGKLDEREITHGIYRFRGRNLELCLGWVRIDGDLTFDRERAEAIVGPNAVFDSGPRPTSFDSKQADVTVLRRLPSGQRREPARPGS